MNRVVSPALQYLSFPILFGGAGVAAWLWYAPEAVAWLMPAIVVAIGLATLALERALPFEPTWRGSANEQKADLLYLALTSAFARVGEIVAWAVAMYIVATLPPALRVWPTHWPMAGQVMLAFAVGDFLPYLYHRASHESNGVLWRIHAIHHAPERMYALNFARFHPLNALLTAGLTLLPLVLLGADAAVVFVAGVLHNVHGILSHANVDFRLGPLNAVFSMAELHRWHHARDPRLANGNYGATILVWDWLFRTRRDPATRVAADAVGLWAGSAVPEGIVQQTVYPFVSSWAPLKPVFSRAARRVGWRCCSAA